jgi:regulator of protease activity HflC (stomatin/prohibitin superfamily)
MSKNLAPPLASPVDYMTMSQEEKLSVGLLDAAGVKAPKVLGMRRDDIADIELMPVPLMAKLGSICLLPIAPCATCFSVGPREEMAVLHFGVLTRMEKEPGCHTSYPFGRTLLKASTKQKTLSLPESKIADATGSPVVVSAILNYRIVDSKKALLNVDNIFNFVNTNAQSVLKQVVGRYTYDQLKSESAVVTKSLLSRLQPIVALAGVEISSMQLNELNYAPEIASGMLKKQQAGALIEARKLIVEGAVSIAQDAVRLLEAGDAGLKMSDSEKVSLVTNLLTVTCAEGDAQPTVPLR